MKKRRWSKPKMMAKRRFVPKKQIGVGGLKLGRAEKRYVNEVLRSNRLSYGPMTRRFEEEWAKAHDSNFAVFCNSGTSALHVALAALKEEYGWKDSDEVLVPSVTFVATANIVLHNGMRPVFVDVDPKTYNLDPALLEEKLTKRTRAVIPVHLLGLPCDMDPILAFARRHNLRVLEDSAETTFGRYRGKSVGSFGDIGCFSTYVAHYVVTGVGGFATTSDPDIAVRLRSLINHGRDSIYVSIDDDRGARGKRLQEIVARRFSFVSLGHSFRATELEAAIGLGQMERKQRIIRARQGNAKRLTRGLRDLREHIQLPTIPAGYDHMFMMYPIVLKNEPKAGLVHFLEENNIETRDLLPLINQPVYRRLYGNLDKRYPVACWLNAGAFYIGCHQELTHEELDYVVEKIHEYFSR